MRPAPGTFPGDDHGRRNGRPLPDFQSSWTVFWNWNDVNLRWCKSSCFQGFFHCRVCCVAPLRRLSQAACAGADFLNVRRGQQGAVQRHAAFTDLGVDPPCPPSQIARVQISDAPEARGRDFLSSFRMKGPAAALPRALCGCVRTAPSLPLSATRAAAMAGDSPPWRRRERASEPRGPEQTSLMHSRSCKKKQGGTRT